MQSQLEGEDPAPPPIANFAGMQFSEFGAGWPPDTVGDVGPNHYIQMVNTSVGIYNKTTGAAIVDLTFNNFFTGPAGTPCDTSNDGDPWCSYDASVDRWIVTNFAWFNFNTGPYYQCIAVSQTGDPVAGGWYFYAMQANTGTFAGDYFNDYPKLGVWPDGYYMSANMFEAVGTGFGVRLWGINKTPLLTGGPLQEVHFDLCLDGACGSFLPSNLRGTAPPAGAPNYFAQIAAPDALDIYRIRRRLCHSGQLYPHRARQRPNRPVQRVQRRNPTARHGPGAGLAQLPPDDAAPVPQHGHPPVAVGHPHRGRRRAGRDTLVRSARSRRHADPVPAG